MLCANTAKYTALSNLRNKNKYFTNTMPLQGVPMLSSWDYRNREKKYRNLNALSPEVLRTTVLRDETATQGLCAAGRAAGRAALASCQTWVQHYRSTPPPNDGSADQWQLHTAEKKIKKKKSAKTNSIALSNKATLSIVIGWPTAEKFTNITPPHVHCKYCFPVCQSRVHQGKKKKAKHESSLGSYKNTV